MSARRGRHRFIARARQLTRAIEWFRYNDELHKIAAWTLRIHPRWPSADLGGAGASPTINPDSDHIIHMHVHDPLLSLCLLTRACQLAYMRYEVALVQQKRQMTVRSDLCLARPTPSLHRNRHSTRSSLVRGFACGTHGSKSLARASSHHTSCAVAGYAAALYGTHQPLRLQGRVDLLWRKPSAHQQQISRLISSYEEEWRVEILSLDSGPRAVRCS